jgi:hypothetical protein
MLQYTSMLMTARRRTCKVPYCSTHVSHCYLTTATSLMMRYPLLITTLYVTEALQEQAPCTSY